MRAKALGWRVCSECGLEKLLAKYFRHPNGPDGFMAHCKACHNGCTETNRRQAAEAMERQLGDPSEEQIAMRTAEIRAKWSDEVMERRRSRKTVHT